MLDHGSAMKMGELIKGASDFNDHHHFSGTCVGWPFFLTEKLNQQN